MSYKIRFIYFFTVFFSVVPLNKRTCYGNIFPVIGVYYVHLKRVLDVWSCRGEVRRPCFVINFGVCGVGVLVSVLA